jgi:hypothetical protein|tara:strand:+ start:723 stop:1061 length:339 start_codon:yes stop_codon:yes gene_type:complete
MKKLIKLILIMFYLVLFLDSKSFSEKKEQYCDLKTVTERIIDVDGNIIDEKTIEKVVCDDSAKHYLEEVGIAKECRPYKWSIPLNGKLVEQDSIACEKLDGSYEILPSYTLD